LQHKDRGGDEISSLKQRALVKLERDLGPLILAALADPKTVEVLCNADGRLWQERLGEPMRCIGDIGATRADTIIKTVAGYHGKEVTRHKPILEGELPLDGSRFAGQVPPVVQAPTFAIRKKAVAIFTLQQYVTAGIMTAGKPSYRRIGQHRNILQLAERSGKTTGPRSSMRWSSVIPPSG
jgi:type IV secretion system protein VirB11